MDFDERYAKRATPLLASATLLVLYTEAMLIPSIPKIQIEFGVTPAEASWVLTAYFLSGTLFAVVFGRLGDIYGRKKLLTIALSIFTLAVSLNSFVPSFHLFLAFRALQGAGMATAPLAYALVREQFPRKMAPFAQGLISAMNGLGLIIALPLGGFIAQHYGWRTTFKSVVPLALLLMILISRHIRESVSGKKGEKFDWPGAGLFGLSITSFLLMVSKVAEWGVRNEKTAGLLILSVLSLVLFLRHERRSDNPFIPLSIAEGNVKASLLGAFLTATAFQLIFLTLTYLLQSPRPYGYGVESFKAGSFMIPMVVAYMPSAPIGGKIVVKTGGKVMGTVGGLLAFGSYLALSVNPHPQLGLMVALISTGASGVALLNVAIINTLTFSTSQEFLGLSTGLFTTFRSIGSSLGPSLGGAVLSAIPVPSAFKISFLTASLLFLTTTILISQMREVIKG